MAAIDVGIIDETANISNGLTTVLSRDNPANLSGTITSIRLINGTELKDVKIGLFYLVSGTTYKCRSSITKGDVAAGDHEYTGLSLAVVAGDLIGIYCTEGFIKGKTTGYTGYYYVIGEYADVDDEAEYTAFADFAQSLYGVGAEPVAGWTGGDVIGVAVAAIAKINGVAIADIKKVNGVA